MIDHSAAVERHYCPTPPPILALDEHDPGGMGAPNIVMAHPEGTRFICDDCGRVRVVAWVEGYVGSSAEIMAGWEWVEETRRQRRARLGLRWWQLA